MKLKYRENHLSVEVFDDVELADFAVFTGKNGCGKTHLLEAINIGKAQLEGIDKSEIVYYNYNDFTVFSGEIAMEPSKSKRKHQADQELTNYVSKVYNLKNVAFQILRTEIHDLVKVTFLELLINRNYDRSNFLESMNFDVLEEFNQDAESNLPNYYQRFTQPFLNLITQLIRVGVKSSEINYDYVKSGLDEAESTLISQIESENEGLVNFLGRKTGKSKLFNLNPEDIESPNFFLEDIEKEELDYQFLRNENSLKKVTAEDWSEEVNFLSKEEFIETYGLSPVEQINTILEEYDCNGYYLTCDKLKVQLGIAKNEMNVKIQLRHREKDYSTTFNQLSSGEKTLIALSMLVHKGRKNKLLPRVLLLDEVDSSLHPSMIRRLLSVLQEHFVGAMNMKVILATHSPTTVALSSPDSVYTVNLSGSTKVQPQEIQSAIDNLTEGFATVNIDDSNLGIQYNIENTSLPILFTEGVTDRIIIETAWNKLYSQPLPFFVQECFDASFLGNLFRRGYDQQDGIIANNENRVLIAMFDFDEEGYNAWNSLSKLDNNYETDPIKGVTRSDNNTKAYSLLLPVPEHTSIKNQVIKGGVETYKNRSILAIEHLFYGIPELDNFFEEETVAGGAQIVVFKGKKRKFANKLNDMDKEKFASITPLFDQILRIIENA